MSVFVRTGSAMRARASGISHVVEHMAFKGTASRDCQRVSLDAERLGAEVNAHTDKDHTAFHMRGLARHATEFVAMLGDIVCASTFPGRLRARAPGDPCTRSTGTTTIRSRRRSRLFDRACWDAPGIPNR